jgi:hypothetical protein
MPLPVLGAQIAFGDAAQIAFGDAAQIAFGDAAQIAFGDAAQIAFGDCAGGGRRSGRQTRKPGDFGGVPAFAGLRPARADAP